MNSKTKQKKAGRKGNKRDISVGNLISTDKTVSDIPANQLPVPIPPVDKEVLNSVEKLVENSYFEYLKELKKRNDKDVNGSIDQLNNILSEYLGPYLLIGYLPNNEPIEMMNASSIKDREALFERLRRTFINYMNE